MGGTIQKVTRSTKITRIGREVALHLRDERGAFLEAVPLPKPVPGLKGAAGGHIAPKGRLLL